MLNATAYVLPLIIFIMVFTSLIKTKSPFSIFLDGAKDGLSTVLKIAPSLIGLIVAVEMFKASGALDVITYALQPISDLLNFPKELMPISILRPISGSGAMALLNNALHDYGADSFIGRVACVMCAASETTFYTTTLYYGSCGIRKTRHTLAAGLIADFAAMMAASISVSLIFGN